MPDDYAHLDASLPGFSEARGIVKAAGDSLLPLGFVGSKFDFYRFVNRFRLAVCFGGLTLHGFTEETSVGYDALTRSFFLWSAFERYADLANDRPPYRALFAHHPRRHIRELAANCRRLDPDHLLTGFLRRQSILPVHESYLQKYQDGHDFSVLTLAASMRHIFAHGHLTAHPNGLPAANLANISLSLGNFFTHFIQSDFARRLSIARAMHAGSDLT